MASIKIIENQDGTITFQNDWPGAEPNQPFGLTAGTMVTWNNTTNRTIELVSDPPGTYITEPIAAGSVSSPIFSAANLKYSCVDPPTPQHEIVIVTS